jgi:hypothetical protein
MKSEFFQKKFWNWLLYLKSLLNKDGTDKRIKEQKGRREVHRDRKNKEKKVPVEALNRVGSRSICG